MDYESLPDEGVLIERAHYLEVGGKEKEALDLIKRVLDFNPDNAEAGRAYIRLTHTISKEAEASEEQAVEGRAIIVAPEPEPELEPKPTPVSSEMQQLLNQNAQMIKLLHKKQTQPRSVQITNSPSIRQASYASKEKKKSKGEYNSAAGCLGILFAFFGIFGISHLLNGKVVEGLIWLLIGSPIYWVIGGFIYGAVSVSTMGLGLICVVAIHFFVALGIGNAGAEN